MVKRAKQKGRGAASAGNRVSTTKRTTTAATADATTTAAQRRRSASDRAARNKGPTQHRALAPARPATDKPVSIHVLSDSTGNLANHMLTVFLTQFPAGSFVMHRCNFLNTPAKLESTLVEIGRTGGVVCHAMVRPADKETVTRFCARHKLACCDLTGSFVEFLSRASGIKPAQNVGVLHEVSEQYRARIEALEFTLAHDDGLGTDTIDQADIVLAGISRTSKTPTSIYLGQHGFRVANVALAIEVEPPRSLLALPRHRVVGLLIDPLRLAEVRQSRGRQWALDSTMNYATIEHIQREVTWSRRLFARQGWRTIDVTNSAVEETAAHIIELMKLPSRDGVQTETLVRR